MRHTRSTPEMDSLWEILKEQTPDGQASKRFSNSTNLLDNKQVLIHFNLPEDYYRCWLHKIWNFGPYSIQMTKWTTHFDPNADSLIVPVWLALFDQRAIMLIGSLIGSPIKVDKATLNMKRPHVTKVCVEIDISKPLRERVWTEYWGSSFWQYKDYEGLPFYCSKCFKLGHVSSVCKSEQSRSSLKAWRPKDNSVRQVKSFPPMKNREKAQVPNDHGKSKVLVSNEPTNVGGNSYSSSKGHSPCSKEGRVLISCPSTIDITSVGFIIRDFQGILVISAAKQTSAANSFEGKVQSIRKIYKIPWKCTSEIGQIWLLLQHMNWSISHVYGEVSCVADALARMASTD